MLDRFSKLLEELKQNPIVELLGVVDPSGACGGKGHEQDWELRFTFDAWKYVGGALKKKKLTIRKQVSADQLKHIMQQVQPLDCLHIQARVTEENSFGTTQGLLVDIIRKDFADTDLQQRVLELKRSVTFEDGRFGFFTLNRRVNWFDAEAIWESTKIRLSLDVGERCDPKECLIAAYTLWDSQSLWNKRVTDLAIAKLLDLKNRAWLQEDEKPFTAEQFRSAIQLTSIVVAPDGSFNFWYNDGDLFWGHDIRVGGSVAEGPTSAGIEG